MELKKVDGYLISYQRQGNDKNGNPIYIINVFECLGGDYKNDYCNMNHVYSIISKSRLDKYGNIKIQSYSIKDTIQRIIDTLSK